MNAIEWVLIGAVVIGSNAFSFFFMRSADRYYAKAKKHLDDALAANKALDEAIALMNYGAQAEAIALLREHGISIRERAE